MKDKFDGRPSAMNDDFGGILGQEFYEILCLALSELWCECPQS
jgi:hypothetical protein